MLKSLLPAKGMWDSIAPHRAWRPGYGEPGALAQLAGLTQSTRIMKPSIYPARTVECREQWEQNDWHSRGGYPVILFLGYASVSSEALS